MAGCQSPMGTLTHVSLVVDVDGASLSNGAAYATLETATLLDTQKLAFLSLSTGLVGVGVVAAVAVVVKLPDSTLKAVKVCVLVLNVTATGEVDASVDPESIDTNLSSILIYY